MYVAVKGGAAAIAAAERLLAEARRGDPAVREIEVRQIREQLGLLVDRVMAEASLADPELAALALKQVRGDAVEAIFLLRAYRTTLPRLGQSEPLALHRMATRRRISAIFKDLPGGQMLGPTFDYTQRLLDFSLLDGAPRAAAAPFDAGSAHEPAGAWTSVSSAASATSALSFDAPPVADESCALDLLGAEGLIEEARPSEGDPMPPDITREPPVHPMDRCARLQGLARADEGWLLGMAYSTQRGYANSHPFAGEIRHGEVPIELVPDELGFPIEIGSVALTECQMVNHFAGSASAPPQFTRGYGLVLGHGERKAMAMALVDRALRWQEFGELPQAGAAAQDAEFVLAHADNVEASGFVQHLKLPHHVTFESEMQLVRALREETPR
jgi:alpha-D-ribose 1-methylphosphonate 5-triphosphate synthase subunit PhnI